MNTTEGAAESLPKNRSKLNFLSVMCLSLASAFLTASVILILQYKQGIPFEFVTSVLLATAAALIIPVAVAVLFRRFVTRLTYPGMVGFMVANFAIAIGTGLAIF